jgi:hypothetical protein
MAHKERKEVKRTFMLKVLNVLSTGSGLEAISVAWKSFKGVKE